MGGYRETLPPFCVDVCPPIPQPKGFVAPVLLWQLANRILFHGVYRSLKDLRALHQVSSHVPMPGPTTRAKHIGQGGGVRMAPHSPGRPVGKAETEKEVKALQAKLTAARADAEKAAKKAVANPPPPARCVRTPR